MLTFYHFDFSLAINHANYLKTLGCRATVGKDNGADKYHVRIISEA